MLAAAVAAAAEEEAAVVVVAACADTACSLGSAPLDPGSTPVTAAAMCRYELACDMVPGEADPPAPPCESSRLLGLREYGGEPDFTSSLSLGLRECETELRPCTCPWLWLWLLPPPPDSACSLLLEGVGDSPGACHSPGDQPEARWCCCCCCCWEACWDTGCDSTEVRACRSADAWCERDPGGWGAVAEKEGPREWPGPGPVTARCVLLGCGCATHAGTESSKW